MLGERDDDEDSDNEDEEVSDKFLQHILRFSFDLDWQGCCEKATFSNDWSKGIKLKIIFLFVELYKKPF